MACPINGFMTYLKENGFNCLDSDKMDRSCTMVTGVVKTVKGSEEILRDAGFNQNGDVELKVIADLKTQKIWRVGHDGDKGEFLCKYAFMPLCTQKCDEVMQRFLKLGFTHANHADYAQLKRMTLIQKNATS